MDRVEREHLKHDRFVDEVSHSVEYMAGHRKQLTLYGMLLAAVIVAGAGVWMYTNKQAEARATGLREAMAIQDAAVGTGSNPYLKTYPTQAEKDTAAIKSWNALATQYPSSDEGAIAQYYLGVIHSDQGKFAEAEKHFKTAVDSGRGPYVSLAKFSLSLLYSRQNKVAESERLLRDLIDSPTILVSKEQAQIELAKVLAPTKPDEARKLLEPLRTSRNAVSRWAITTIGEAKLSERK